MLNPHPTLIPAIEAGFVERVSTAFGSELGMGGYVSEPADLVFLSAPAAICVRTAHWRRSLGAMPAISLSAATLQIDAQGNSSTATKGRIAGFGGAPNMGRMRSGRRHVKPGWLRAGRDVRRFPAWPQAGGADGRDPPGRRHAEFCRTAR